MLQARTHAQSTYVFMVTILTFCHKLNFALPNPSLFNPYFKQEVPKIPLSEVTREN